MDIRGEFWSAVEKAKENKKESKPKTLTKKFSFVNEPAYYLDIKTNEDLNDDLDVQLLYQMTKTKSKDLEMINESSYTEFSVTPEMKRREWRLNNSKNESLTSKTNSNTSASENFGGYSDGYVSDYFD